MRYELATDLRSNGYSGKVISKVHNTLMGLIKTPGTLIFRENNNKNIIGIQSSTLSGMIDIEDEDAIRMTIYINKEDGYKELFCFKDDNVDYIVENANGIYTLRGNINGKDYKACFYDKGAIHYIKNRYSMETYELSQIEDIFNKNGIIPDIQDDHLELFPKECYSDNIFKYNWINELHYKYEINSYGFDNGEKPRIKVKKR